MYMALGICDVLRKNGFTLHYNSQAMACFKSRSLNFPLIGPLQQKARAGRLKT